MDTKIAKIKFSLLEKDGLKTGGGETGQQKKKKIEIERQKGEKKSRKSDRKTNLSTTAEKQAITVGLGEAEESRREKLTGEVVT